MTIRRLRRLIAILRAVLIYGLDELFPHKRYWPLTLARVTCFWWRNRHQGTPRGERLKMALVELGPIHVKFGQLMATRQDILPADIVSALESLQDKVKPFDGKTSRKIIEQSLPGPLASIFSDISEEPVASASIAQVHYATLQPEYAAKWSLGDQVVVKVVRPGIAHKIEKDIILLRWLAGLFERYHIDGKRLKPQRLVDDYETTIMQELDMVREAANTKRLRHNAQSIAKLYVPDIYSELSSERILVQERISGIPVNDIEALKAAGTNLEKLAHAGTEVFFTQVFRDSFFHADMHAGNIFVDVSDPENPSYIGIDCGICGTLNKQDKRYLAENLLAFFNQDYRRVAELHVYSGWVNPATDVETFTQAIEEVCAPIFGKPLNEIAVGEFLVNLFDTARRFDMEVQPQLVLLQKTLLYIEGLGRRLYPELDLWSTAKPFLEDWVKEQIGFGSVWRDLKSHAPEWRMTIPEIPQRLHAYLHREPMQAYQQKQLLEQLIQQQSRQHKRQSRLTLGLLLAVVSLWLDGQDQTLNWVSDISLLSGIIVAISGLFSSNGQKLFGKKER